MVWKNWRAQKEKVILLFFAVAAVALAFFIGRYVQYFLLFPVTFSKSTTQTSPTPSQVQISDPNLKSQAQNELTKFLEYLKSKGTPDMHLTDYRNLKLSSIFMKGQEIHALFAFDALPEDQNSSQKLVQDGATLQKDGWIIKNKAYLILTKQGISFTTKEVSFSPPTNF